MNSGMKHTIQCLCVLPQYRTRPNPPYHEFVVFSEFESDEFVQKHAECNNCGVIHKITGLCKSEIEIDRHELCILGIEDIDTMLPKQVSSVLKSYQCDLPSWEHALFIINEEKWGEFIVLLKSENKEGFDGKLLRFKKSGRYIIEPFIDRRNF